MTYYYFFSEIFYLFIAISRGNICKITIFFFFWKGSSFVHHLLVMFWSRINLKKYDVITQCDWHDCDLWFWWLALFTHFYRWCEWLWVRWATIRSSVCLVRIGTFDFKVYAPVLKSVLQNNSRLSSSMRVIFIFIFKQSLKIIDLNY